MSATELPEPVDEVTTPIRLAYDYTPGRDQSRFLNAMAEGKIRGRRCPSCEKVYLPPRGVCSMCGVFFEEESVEVADRGTVATFAVVNVPSTNIDIELPYVAADVVFDGADTTTMFLLRGVRPDDVRMGMRVEARWRPRDEWETSMANIECVVPIDEPDAPYESYKEYV
jgi:uncharacterized protein